MTTRGDFPGSGDATTKESIEDGYDVTQLEYNRGGLERQEMEPLYFLQSKGYLADRFIFIHSLRYVSSFPHSKPSLPKIVVVPGNRNSPGLQSPSLGRLFGIHRFNVPTAHTQVWWPVIKSAPLTFTIHFLRILPYLGHWWNLRLELNLAEANIMGSSNVRLSSFHNTEIYVIFFIVK